MSIFFFERFFRSSLIYGFYCIWALSNTYFINELYHLELELFVIFKFYNKLIITKFQNEINKQIYIKNKYKLNNSNGTPDKVLN